MELSGLYIAVLTASLMFLFAQLFVKKKQTAHLLFAIFCGSVAMTIAKKISGDSLGSYQYLIGMGACATCNCYWLLSRSLFRVKNAIQPQHLLFAVVIALLIMANQGYLFVHSETLASASSPSVVQHILRELTILLSSSILVLSFWEGCRGYSKDTKKGKLQRLLFLSTFGLAVSLSKVSQGVFSESPIAVDTITMVIILFVLINTQIFMMWRFNNKASPAVAAKADSEDLSLATEIENTPHPDECALAEEVENLLIKQSLYLQANLKVADIARALDVSEYKVSRALRNNLSAKNFNQYVNELRIQHAKVLLADPDKQKWPVIVVGLESGFASVGPFTRTFKSSTGYTPNQYRQSLVS